MTQTTISEPSMLWSEWVVCECQHTVPYLWCVLTLEQINTYKCIFIYLPFTMSDTSSLMSWLTRTSFSSHIIEYAGSSTAALIYRGSAKGRGCGSSGAAVSIFTLTRIPRNLFLREVWRHLTMPPRKRTWTKKKLINVCVHVSKVCESLQTWFERKKL